YNVDAANDRHQVGDHGVAAQFAERTQVDKRWRAEVHAVRAVAAVAGQVAAEFSAWAFHPDIYLALWHFEAFRPQLEMVDDGLHATAQFGARRRHELAIVGAERPFRQALDTLLDDAHALVHLLHPAHKAIIHVAVFAQRHVKLVIFVAGVGHRLADVPVDARAAQRRASGAPGQRILRRQHANALRAVNPEWVLHEQRFVIVQLRREIIDEPL